MTKWTFQQFWLLILPAIAWFYMGLFVTILIWYPSGLDPVEWREHILNFSIIYIFWVIVFFVYTLFDLSTFRSRSLIISRLLGAMLTSGVIAVAYFYFQPAFILTPRRFLLAHLLFTTVGLIIWYLMIQKLLPRIWNKNLYLHPLVYEQNLHSGIEDYLNVNKTMGWRFSGKFVADSLGTPAQYSDKKMTVVLPINLNLEQSELQSLFNHKRQGVEFLEYHRFIELTQRMVPLEKVSEVWFLRSVSYTPRRLSDAIKRLLDIFIGAAGSLVLLILLPIIFIAIKLDSKGPVFFVQQRVGRLGRPFKLYKLRTMTIDGANNIWTATGDKRITRVGKLLRKLRLDELPQFWNILIGNMSLVGPRPEQVGIVEELKTQIPYYDERHIVKPGLTGWGQLHVYANSLEGTKLKLQYDFYYIKHRSLWFDLEIILRTIFHIISLQGQ